MAKQLSRHFNRALSTKFDRREGLLRPSEGLAAAGCSPAKKAYHKGVHNPYQINYESLSNTNADTGAVVKNPYLKSILPETVRGNVKNVQGAERGFLSVYPDLVHVISQAGGDDSRGLTAWNTKVLTHNLSLSVLGQRFGLLVPITYRQLHPDASKEQMKLSHLLGWGVEMIRASDILFRQTMSGPRKTEATGEWARKHNLGEMAFNDAIFLQNSVHVLLQHYFTGDNRYTHYLDAYLTASRAATKGRLLSFDRHPSNKVGLSGFDYSSYKAFVRNDISALNYCLPVTIALHQFGLHEHAVHRQARMIFNEIGYFTQINHDYANAFLESNNSDIVERKLTWLVVMARQRGNAAQNAVLEKCYGSGDPEDIAAVKQVYDELKMHKLVKNHLNEQRNDILQRIQQISKLDKVGLSQEFMFKLIDSMNMNRIS